MSEMRANPVAEDVNEIYAAIQRIREESTPRCPVAPSRTLYECLRSPGRCGTTCEYKDDWIGPDGD